MPANQSADANSALVRRLYNGINQRAEDVFDLFAADIVHHNRMPGTPEGREGNRQGMHALFAAFPDLEVTIEDLVADGDRVAVRTRLRGTHVGPLYGSPGTGKTVSIEAMAFFRILGGLIVEEWLVADQPSLLRQIRTTS
jgi:steroid delta-isomerase-like uncharacterized protein